MSDRLPLGHEYHPCTSTKEVAGKLWCLIFTPASRGEDACHFSDPAAPGIPYCGRPRSAHEPQASSAEPPASAHDKLGEIAQELCSRISGASYKANRRSHESFNPPCDDCGLIRAALEAVVRECANTAGDGNGNMGRECERQILRHWRLKE